MTMRPSLPHQLAVLIYALLLCAPASTAQSLAPEERGAPPLVIRTEARLVLVDVVVRDKKGAAGALGVADFRLWEDGKERPIAGLSTAELSNEVPRQDALVFLFDAGSASEKASNLNAARQDVARFAGAYASPNRYMAVMNFDGILSVAQNLTARAERIQQAAVAAAASSGNWSREVLPEFRSLPSLIGDASYGWDPNDRLGPRACPGRGCYDRGDPRVTKPPSILDAITAVADSMAVVRGRKSLTVIGFRQSTHSRPA